MTWRWVIVVVVVVTTLGVLQCRRVVRGRVEPWMTCIDCLDHELDSVAAQGGTVIGVLKDYAVHGAGNHRIGLVRALEDSALARRRRWAVLQGSPDTALIQSFGDAYAANVDRAFRIRAYVALHRINSPAAQSAISAALAAGALGAQDSLRVMAILAGPP